MLVTVVLVAFLVLLLVGLATFTRVETGVSDNSQQLSKARQNALMGLNIALGNLQRFAGPDKVSTARADITAVAAPMQPYFTGTWDNTGTLTSWLVSGNENAPTTGVTPATALNASGGTFPVNDSAGQVYLLAKNSVSSNAAGVLVAKQSITAPAGSVPGLSAAATVGNYAWWVGDEGIKASAALIDPLLATSPISYNNAPGADPVGDDWSDAVKKERLNQLQIPRQRLEKLLSVVDPDVAANVTALPKVANRPQLQFLSGSPSAAQVNATFHDLTPMSRGVLADTAAGTLRADLSGSTGTAGAISSYQILRPANVPSTTPAGVEAEFYPVVPNVTAGTWPTYGLYPVLSEAGIRIFFNVSGGNVQLNYLLDAELWNPCAATLLTDATRTLRFSVTFPAAVNIQVTDSTGPTSQVVTIAANTTYSANIANTVSWQPGQIVRVRGGATMDVVSAGVGANAVSLGAATVATIDTVDVQSAVQNLKFKLELVNTSTSAASDLQVLTLASNFQSKSGMANDGLTPAFGYGYEFNRDLRVWTEGTQTQSRDPRLPILDDTAAGVTFEETVSSQWSLSDIDGNKTGGFGTGDLSDGARVVLFDLPRQEITSVAQLRHLIGAKAYELGNAWGGTINNRFDSQFVSSVPRNYAWSPTGSEPRPNRYLDVYVPDGVAAATLTDLRNSTDSARYQLIRGAFNINSTSVSAWKAVLGAKLAGWDHSGSAVGGITLDNAFFRTEHGAQQRTVLSGSVPPVPNSTDLATLSDAQLLGATGRQLDEKTGATEVTNLATEIVRLLKVRGKPFASLADFVNSGLIQTAIDNAGLNNVISNTKLRYTAPALTQADVVACIAPFMAARSDTFVIRAYGDVKNPVTGATESRAWCEATVQRLPDLVSNASAAVATVINPPAASNPFGRRFKIVSFRWLTSDDL